MSLRHLLLWIGLLGAGFVVLRLGGQDTQLGLLVSYAGATLVGLTFGLGCALLMPGLPVWLLPAAIGLLGAALMLSSPQQLLTSRRLPSLINAVLGVSAALLGFICGLAPRK